MTLEEKEFFDGINELAMDKLGIGITKFEYIMRGMPLYSQFYMELNDHINNVKPTTVEHMVDVLLLEIEIFELMEEN